MEDVMIIGRLGHLCSRSFLFGWGEGSVKMIPSRENSVGQGVRGGGGLGDVAGACNEWRRGGEVDASHKGEYVYE